MSVDMPGDRTQERANVIGKGHFWLQWTHRETRAYRLQSHSPGQLLASWVAAAPQLQGGPWLGY